MKNVAIVVGRRWHAPSLAKALSRIGYSVTVYTSEPWRSDEVHFERIAMRPLMRIAGRYPLVASVAYAAFTQAVKFRLRRRKYDLIIAWSGFGLGLSEFGEKSILVRGSTHIASQRESLLAARSTVYPSRAMVRREIAEYAEFSLVTVPTSVIASDVRWGSARVVVAPYANDDVADLPRMARPSIVSALYIGELSLRKGIDRFLGLRAVVGVDECHVAGRSRDGKFERSIEGVHFHGHVSKSDIRALIRSSSFLAVLSREEGQARAGLEAMREGLPLMVTTASGLAEYCQEGGAGVVVSADCEQEELESAVRSIVVNWDSYSEAGYRLSRLRTWENHARTLSEAAQELEA